MFLIANLPTFEVKCEFRPLTGIEVVPGQIHTKNFHLFCVCVDDVVRLGVEPWRGCKFL